MITNICEQCGKEFKVIPSRKDTAKYCSMKCYAKAKKDKLLSKETKRKISKAMQGKNHWNYKDGESIKDLKFRESIRKRDNYICQVCGKTQKEYYRKLDTHHIDYNKENNIPENLITLCLSCHIKTNKNREYWAAYFKNKNKLSKKIF